MVSRGGYIQKAIIVDLDGTLCDISHRRPLVEKEKPDWKSFNHPWQIKRDKLNNWCFILIRAMAATGYKIVFVTGREGTKDIKIATEDWFRLHLTTEWLWLNSRALFRKEGDFRKDYVIKKEIYETYIKDRYDVLFVIDDRKQVVDMWREIGLVCLQCDKGDF